ncbi:MAG: hypothetical protein ABI481_08195 [Pyrinomonadaceae bacterium]
MSSSHFDGHSRRIDSDRTVELDFVRQQFNVGVFFHRDAHNYFRVADLKRISRLSLDLI